MMTPDVTETIRRLQKRRDRTDGYLQIEKIEEALDTVLANPARAHDPDILERNALAQARKTIRRRRGLLAEHVTAQCALDETSRAPSQAGILEIANFLERGVTASDRLLLAATAAGAEAEELAEDLRIPVPRARERLSRARARARILWAA